MEIADRSDEIADSRAKIADRSDEIADSRAKIADRSDEIADSRAKTADKTHILPTDSPTKVNRAHKTLQNDKLIHTFP
ncbi:hypothetical protein ACQKII_14860 [Lysinibacillus sp. NPDC048646]|uniref:hypothetical protein n=1 Tax=Lysinibacillus sp. NPDC048646 TaxID=3390574 RepID=UPI003D08185D